MALFDSFSNEFHFLLWVQEWYGPMVCLLFEKHQKFIVLDWWNTIFGFLMTSRGLKTADFRVKFEYLCSDFECVPVVIINISTTFQTQKE